MFYPDPFDVIIIGGVMQALRPQWPQRVWGNRPCF